MKIDYNYMGYNFIDQEWYFKYYRVYDEYTVFCNKCKVSVIVADTGYYYTNKVQPKTGSDFDDLLSCDEMIIKGIIE